MAAMTVKTWFEEGVEKGVEKGLHTGQRQLLRDMIEKRFGTLSDGARQRLEAWPAEQLTELGLAFVEGKSLAELGLED
jgi:hypothetical protein